MSKADAEALKAKKDAVSEAREALETAIADSKQGGLFDGEEG